MKAITILQPWASLIVFGQKQIETRGWQTKRAGRLLIHAGKTFSPFAQELCTTEPFRSCLHVHGIKSPSDLAPMLGKIIGVVEVVDCIPTESLEESLSERERAFGDYRPGCWGWLLKNPTPLATALPQRGALGLFEVVKQVDL